jgi:hypothetical protein
VGEKIRVRNFRRIEAFLTKKFISKMISVLCKVSVKCLFENVIQGFFKIPIQDEKAYSSYKTLDRISNSIFEGEVSRNGPTAGLIQAKEFLQC